MNSQSRDDRSKDRPQGNGISSGGQPQDDRSNGRPLGNGISGGPRNDGVSGTFRNEGVSDRPQQGRAQQQAGAITS